MNIFHRIKWGIIWHFQTEKACKDLFEENQRLYEENAKLFCENLSLGNEVQQQLLAIEGLKKENHDFVLKIGELKARLNELDADKVDRLEETIADLEDRHEKIFDVLCEIDNVYLDRITNPDLRDRDKVDLEKIEKIVKDYFKEN